MIAFGKLIGELHADLREDLLIEHVGPQGPLSQVGLESLETYLDPDRAEGRALSPCPEENVPGHIADRRFHLRPIRHVLVERPFDADRLRVGALLDRQLLDAPGDRPQPDRVLAHEFLQLRPRESSQLADCPDADPLEDLGRLGPHAADLRDGQRLQEGGHLLRSYDLQPVGLRHVGGHLRDRLFGPTPIVQARPSFSRTAALTFAAYAATSSNPWTFDVMSRNASSMLTCSRTSAKDRRTSMTLSEAAM